PEVGDVGAGVGRALVQADAADLAVRAGAEIPPLLDRAAVTRIGRPRRGRAAPERARAHSGQWCRRGRGGARGGQRGRGGEARGRRGRAAGGGSVGGRVGGGGARGGRGGAGGRDQVERVEGGGGLRDV